MTAVSAPQLGNDSDTIKLTQTESESAGTAPLTMDNYMDKVNEELLQLHKEQAHIEKLEQKLGDKYRGCKCACVDDDMAGVLMKPIDWALLDMYQLHKGHGDQICVNDLASIEYVSKARAKCDESCFL